MKKKISSFLIMLLVLSSVFVPMLLATSAYFDPPTGITDPEKYYGVYLRPDGSMRADSIRIPILDPSISGFNMGGLLFPNITINRNALINEANLTLWFEGDTLEASSSLNMRVYGMLDAFAPGATLSGLDRNNAVTVAYTDVALTNLTSPQYVGIDVTNIVSEITSLYGWTSGRGLGFMIYGEEADTARSYQSNIGANYPKLFVRYDESTEPDSSIYKGYTIYQNSTSSPNIMGITYDLQYTYTFGHFFTNIPVVNFSYTELDVRMVSASSHGYQQEILIDDKLYLVGYNASATDVAIYESEDYGITWTWKLNIADLGTNGLQGAAIASKDNDFCWVLFTTSSGAGGGTYLSDYRISNNTSSYTKTLMHGSTYAIQQRPYIYYDEQTDHFFGTSNGGISSSGTSRTIIMEWYAENVTKVGSNFESTTTATRGKVMRWNSTHLIMLNQVTNAETVRIWMCSDVESNSWSLYQTYNPSLDMVTVDYIIGNDNESQKVLAMAYVALVGGENNPVYTLSYDGGYTWSAYKYKNSGLSYWGTNMWLFNGTIWTSHVEQVEDHIYLARYDRHLDEDLDYEFVASGLSPNLYEYIPVQGAEATGGGGWVVIPPPGYPPPNPDCLAAAVTLEDVEKCIDTVYPTSGDDPSPPGWDETGYFTRGKMKLYFLFIGLGFVFLPLYFIVNASGYDKIRFVWLMLLSWVIGLALLMSVGRI